MRILIWKQGHRADIGQTVERLESGLCVALCEVPFGSSDDDRDTDQIDFGVGCQCPTGCGGLNQQLSAQTDGFQRGAQTENRAAEGRGPGRRRLLPNAISESSGTQATR